MNTQNFIMADFDIYSGSVFLGILLAIFCMAIYRIIQSGKFKSLFRKSFNTSKGESVKKKNAAVNVDADSSNEVETVESTAALEKLKGEYDTLKHKHEELKESSESTANELRIVQEKFERDKVNYNTKNPISYHFYSEVMATAGPRKKKGDDIDYGEDTCGVVHTKNKILFWLLDGTSDQDIQFCTLKEGQELVEMFSSRLMVQSIAKLLPKAFNEDTNIDAKRLTEKVISMVSEQWVERFNYDYFKKIFAKRKTLKCGTTLIVGTLDMSGNLDTFIIGDSKLLLFDIGKKLKLATSDTNSNQDFVAKVVNNDLILLTGKNEENIPLAGGVGNGTHLTEKNIYSLICHSDGIDSARSQKIQSKIKEGYIAMKDAMNNIPVNSRDDKSMLIIELRND